MRIIELKIGQKNEEKFYLNGIFLLKNSIILMEWHISSKILFVEYLTKNKKVLDNASIIELRKII